MQDETEPGIGFVGLDYRESNSVHGDFSNRGGKRTYNPNQKGSLLRKIGLFGYMREERVGE